MTRTQCRTQPTQHTMHHKHTQVTQCPTAGWLHGARGHGSQVPRYHNARAAMHCNCTCCICWLHCTVSCVKGHSALWVKSHSALRHGPVLSLD